MKSKKILYGLIAAAVYLLLWEGAARALDLPFAIPTIGATLSALWRLAVTADFWKTIGSSLLRILLGLGLGTLLGCLFAILTVHSKLARALISPVQSVIRCTPVASFIMILWVILGKNGVPAAIALLMVTPVLWKNLVDGYAALDPQLNEMLRVFRVSGLQRYRLLVLPGLKRPFLTGFASAAGLAWKAGIAAEIIAYTSDSIGKKIADARNLFDGAEMMAWTLCVVLLSLGIEKLITLLTAEKRGGQSGDNRAERAD